MTEAVFAFFDVSRDRTYSPLLKRQLRYHYAITTYRDELPQLLNNLLDYPIQLTTYLLSCELLSRPLRSMSGLGFRIPPLTTRTAYQPLSATSRTNTLPFLIPVNWAGFVVRSAPPVTL